jgi:tripartite-type tricarboxylate transporter receptor subunit TctC
MSATRRKRPLRRREVLRWAGVGTLLPLLASTARAAWKPARPIEMIISYSAGGGADTLARYLIGALRSRTQWTIVPLNKAGAGGGLMLSDLQRAAPDGHTIGLCLSLQLGRSLAPGLPAYTIDDFTPIAAVARGPMALVARSEQMFTDLAGMKQLAQREKRPITIGTTPSLEWIVPRIGSDLGVEVTQVNFKGGAEMLQATLGGHVDAFLSGGSHLPLEKAGRLRVVAAVTPERLPTSPDAPTLIEQGVQASVDSRFVVIGPKNMPAEVAAELSSEFGAVMADPEVRRHLENTLSLISAYLPPEAMKRALAAEAAKGR